MLMEMVWSGIEVKCYDAEENGGGIAGAVSLSRTEKILCTNGGVGFHWEQR